MSKCVFCLVDYNCMIILLSVTVFVCHDKGNVFFCTINSPVYVYWKQEYISEMDSLSITHPAISDSFWQVIL